MRGEQYQCSYKRFAKIHGFTNGNDLGKNNIRDHREPKDEEIYYTHLDNTSFGDYCQTSHMLPYYHYVNLVVRQTIIPKGGNARRIQSTTKTLTFFNENGGDFSVFDVIWKEIMTTSWTPLNSCTHAPYIMRIEVVTKKCFVKIVAHGSYVPLRIDPEDPSCQSRKVKTTSSRSRPSPIPSPPSRPSSSRAAPAGRSFPCHLDHDDLRSMIKKGFIAIYK